MFLSRVLILFCFSIMLTSCFYHSDFIQHRETEYLSARSTPPLRLPPGISSYAFSSYYPVSNQYYPAEAANVSLKPPGL